MEKEPSETWWHKQWYVIQVNIILTLLQDPEEQIKEMIHATIKAESGQHHLSSSYILKYAKFV